MNPEPKSRTVTCRLTAEEYERFLNLSPVVGSRNVSELARIAINAFLQQPVEEGSGSLESRVADLEDRVQLLSRDFQRAAMRSFTKYDEARYGSYGDSHAASLASYLVHAAPMRGWAVAQYTKVNCPPTGPVSVYSTSIPSLSDQCAALNSAADRAVAQNPAIRTVLITGLWTDFVDPKYPRRHYSPPRRKISGVIPQEMSYQNLKIGIDEVIKDFVRSGKRVIIAIDVLEVPLLRAVSSYIPPRKWLGQLVAHEGGDISYFTMHPATTRRKWLVSPDLSQLRIRRST